MMSAKKTIMKYPGNELELFSKATNWKEYWSSIVRTYVGGRVLDVGAGIGANMKYLHSSAVNEWFFIEPDPDLVDKLKRNKDVLDSGASYKIINGTLSSLKNHGSVNTILYADVLEHIEDDRSEMLSAANQLEIGGHLIIVAPSHNFLFSDFDKSVGHYRRYTKKDLLKIAPNNLELVKSFYLDSLGVSLSLANKVILKSSTPTYAQISFWDKLIVPVSRWVDRMLMFTVGKSVVVVFRRIENVV